MPPIPTHIKVEAATQVTITWDDGRVSVYPVAYLRGRCPCATCRQARQDTNPLRILPEGMNFEAPIAIKNAHITGNYALNITFSDDHATGIYAFDYLRRIDPAEEKDAGTQGR